MTIKLELSAEHAQVVQDACEMLMRLKLGQTMFPTELMLDMPGGIDRYDIKEFCLRRNVANAALKIFLNACGYAEGTSKDEVEHMAYEVWGSIRHAIWKHDNPGVTDSWDVRSQPPLCESGKPMPKCRVEG